MFELIEMYGDNEPWWFFADWQLDIINCEVFSDFDSACLAFQQRHRSLESYYKKHQDKPEYLAAFWNPGEVRFCEECDDDLQQYRGLLLLEQGKKIVNASEGIYETINYSGKTQCCTRFSQSTRSNE